MQAGVFAIVKDVFLPWYNAYRFLVQNVQRWEQTTGKAFEPSQVCTCSARVMYELAQGGR